MVALHNQSETIEEGSGRALPFLTGLIVFMRGWKRGGKPLKGIGVVRCGQVQGVL